MNKKKYYNSFTISLSVISRQSIGGKRPTWSIIVMCSWRNNHLTGSKPELMTSSLRLETMTSSQLKMKKIKEELDFAFENMKTSWTCPTTRMCVRGGSRTKMWSKENLSSKIWQHLIRPIRISISVKQKMLSHCFTRS